MQNSARAGVALLVLVVVLLNSVDRYRIAPSWLEETAFTILIGSLALSALTRTPLFRRIELVALWGTVTLGLFYNTINLGNVIDKLVFYSVQPSTLFLTAVTIWIDNVIVFALAYWLVDGGGPDARNTGRALYPDFDFPAYDRPERVRPHWRPGLVDYVFLGFTTATAFSPTEGLPLTPRAKILMIAQSAVSLTTVAIVAARAVNIIQ